jgi:hypothetical protein
MAEAQKIEFPAEKLESTGPGSVSGTEPGPVSETAFRHSTTFGELCKALCQAALQFPEIAKDTENPYFKSQYADLATLIKATRPILARNGLCIVQAPQSSERGVKVTTMLMHSSGEWLANDLEMPSAKSDAQGKGSAITYARRYSYQAILNIAAEDDDDGNAAAGKTQQDRKSQATEAGPGAINPVQIRAFWSACKTGKKDVETATAYLGALGYENVDELPKAKFQEAIDWALGK